MAQLSQMCGGDPDEWHLFTANHEAAYKKQPIDPKGQRAAVVALRRPKSKKRLVFATRALVSGSVAAVRHYNILSGIWSAIFFCAPHAHTAPQLFR